MASNRFVPGEADYAGHLLRTASYCIDHGRYGLAGDLLETAEHLPLTAGEDLRLREIAARLLEITDQLLRGQRPAKESNQSHAGRLLAFAPRSTMPRALRLVAARP